MQTIVYYFASTVKSIANGIIFMETAVLLLALFSQQLTENTSFAIRAGNLITNIGIILIPFLVMTGFLYYEVSIFRKEHAPQDHTLYSTKSGKQL
jgi:ABC-type multidrug transport system permease subunit